MQLKQGVKLLGVKQETILAMYIVDSVYRDVVAQGVTITSICDGEHGANSLHYAGYAFDVRTRYNLASDQWTTSIKKQLVKGVRDALTSDYDVILECDHIHVEYQPNPHN